VSDLELELEWCRVCCSQHGQFVSCPGYVEISGHEKRGRQFMAHRPANSEAYQVLVAPAGELWQARIITIPDFEWKVPGSRRAAKFFDRSEVQAERKAVLYIQKFCKDKRVDLREIRAGQALGQDGLSTGRRARGKRYDHEMTALFGVDRPDWPARISNVSDTGVCLETRRPENVGQRVRIVLQVEEFRIPLVGVVAWSRRRSHRGLPLGMGVELDDPPAVYLQLLASLREPEPES
jgi:hypothetical protein